MPKSSTASFTPSEWSRPRVSRDISTSSISTLSVISSSTRDGSIPVLASTEDTSSTRLG